MTRTFAAPRELVWRAWTQPEHLTRWFAGTDCQPDFAEVDLRVGGRWRSGMCWKEKGKTFIHHGQFREIAPHHRLVFTHAWEEGDDVSACQSTHQTLVTVTLEDQGEGTRMTFEQVGFENIASRDSHEHGWSGAFDYLTQHLGATAEEADLSIVISRVFDAPIELVWEAWTNPTHIARWFGPRGFTTRVTEHDFRVGGTWRYVMVGPDGKEYPGKGVFREIVPLQRIVSTDDFDEGIEKVVDIELPQGIVVAETFEAAGKGTRVTIRMIHPTIEDRRKHEAMGVVEGWGSTLDCLEDLLTELQ